MNEQNANKPILKFLETLELVGITFIRDYIQFLFDGPVLNTYTLPVIKIENRIITSTDFGYYDTLCSLINKKILSAYEDEKEEKIAIKFEDDIEFFVSLKSEDRNCAEAAMLQLETDGEWNIWQVIVVATKTSTTALRKVGSVLESVDDVMANPNLLKGKSPLQVEGILGKTPGWRIETLGQGSQKGNGWVLRQFNAKGNPTGPQLRWHPGGGHHGPTPYWRVVGPNGDLGGIIR